MAGENATLGMNQSDFCIPDLTVTGTTTDLPHGLGQCKHRSWVARVTMGQQPTMCIDRQSPARRTVPGNFSYLIPRNYTLSAKLNF